MSPGEATAGDGRREWGGESVGGFGRGIADKSQRPIIRFFNADAEADLGPGITPLARASSPVP